MLPQLNAINFIICLQKRYLGYFTKEDPSTQSDIKVSLCNRYKAKVKNGSSPKHESQAICLASSICLTDKDLPMHNSGTSTTRAWSYSFLLLFTLQSDQQFAKTHRKVPVQVTASPSPEGVLHRQTYPSGSLLCGNHQCGHQQNLTLRKTEKWKLVQYRCFAFVMERWNCN